MTREKSQQEKFHKMTTEPVEKLTVQLGIPTIITMLITAFYNMTDSFFVGQQGNTSATAAIGIVFSLMSFLQAVGYFFGHGSGNFISRALGKQDINNAEKMAAAGFFYSMFIGILWTIFGLLFLTQLALILGSTPTNLIYVQDYMKILLLGAPFICPAYVMNNQLRFQGNAFFSMLGMVTGAVINIILDPIFILVLNLGVKGAAIATLFGQAISFLILLWGTYHGDSIPIRLKNFSLTPGYIKEIFRGGTPSLCRQGVSSLATIILNHFLGIYGDAAQAAFSIVSRIIHFIQSALIGFGQGFQPVCGFNYGAGKYNRVRKAFLFCIKSSIIVLVILSIIGIIFSNEIISLFQKNDVQIIEIGTKNFVLQLGVLPLFAIITMTNMMLQTMGKVIPASIISLSRQGIVFIPAICILAYFFGLEGIIWTQTISDILSCMISIPFMVNQLKRFKTE